MIKTKNHMAGSEWWISSETLSFSSILRQSRLPDHWARYDSLNLNDVKTLLTPVNRYVFSLYPKPEIVKRNENVITFRQRTHAEIWVEEKSSNVLYAVDKCHQRQFYPSSNSFILADCFLPTYKFYVPWFINKDVETSLEAVQDEETPFHIYDKTFFSKFVDKITPYVDAEFVDFKIKNTGKYALKDGYGIINKGTAMYDMSVSLTDKEIMSIEECYDE